LLVRRIIGFAVGLVGWVLYFVGKGKAERRKEAEQ